MIKTKRFDYLFPDVSTWLPPGWLVDFETGGAVAWQAPGTLRLTGIKRAAYHSTATEARGAWVQGRYLGNSAAPSAGFAIALCELVPTVGQQYGLYVFTDGTYELFRTVGIGHYLIEDLVPIAPLPRPLTAGDVFELWVAYDGPNRREVWAFQNDYVIAWYLDTAAVIGTPVAARLEVACPDAASSLDVGELRGGTLDPPSGGPGVFGW